MPEHERELRVVEVTYVCDKCGKGTMVYSDEIYVYGHLEHDHYCTNCHERRTFYDEKYPFRRFYYKDGESV